MHAHLKLYTFDRRLVTIQCEPEQALNEQETIESSVHTCIIIILLLQFCA